MIVANFNKGTTISQIFGLWQYDYGQVLRIQGLNLPTAVEIHFSYQRTGGEAKTRIGMTKDGVTDVVIPDSMLENQDTDEDYKIYAFVYVTDDSSGQTEYCITMNVQSRPKPEAFDRPEDGEIFKEAIQAVRESADQAAESARQAESIKESVQDMVDTIGNIDEQVQAVKEFAQKAETASSNAALSESRAKESETAAETAKESAETAAESARQSATVVEQAVSGFDGKVVEANIAIENAKTGAVKAVEDKGNEVLQSIPPDFETQMANKVDKQQGIENKGKALVVGEDGNVVVGEVQGGDGIAIINTMSGASPLVIPDSAERVNKGFGLVGNTEQEQTTGAQLIPPILSEKKTINGITFEPVSKNEIKVYGTATEDSVMPYNYFTVKPGTYTFSINQKVIKSKFRTCFANKNGQPRLDISNAQSSSTDVFDTEEQFTVLLRIYQGVEINMNICFMFNEGGSALPYEPYTGGKPSPSPDYPQEIKNVGKWNEEKQKYEVDVKVTGKNLFDKEKAKIIDNWSPSTQDGKSGYLDFPIYVGKGNKFTVSIKPPTEKVPELYLGFAVKRYGANTGWLYHATSTFNPAQTKIAEEDYIFLRCIKPKVADLMNIVQEIQVEISLIQTSYQPYKEQLLTLTSDRPITKWDKLVEQDGQIGWLYQSGNAKLTNVRTQYPNEDIKGKTFSRFETTIHCGFDDFKRKEMLCTKLRNNSTDDDIFFNTLGGGYIVLYFNKNLAIDNIEKANAWILSNSDIDFLYYDSVNAPTFIPLPQSEQDAIRTLTTYYPTTVITVDGGEVDPNIEVTYTADTKNYIDKKIEAINKAIVTTQKALLQEG